MKKQKLTPCFVEKVVASLRTEQDLQKVRNYWEKRMIKEYKNKEFEKVSNYLEESKQIIKDLQKTHIL